MQQSLRLASLNNQIIVEANISRLKRVRGIDSSLARIAVHLILVIRW